MDEKTEKQLSNVYNSPAKKNVLETLNSNFTQNTLNSNSIFIAANFLTPSTHRQYRANKIIETNRHILAK